MPESLNQALTEAARTAVEASAWERDQKAWNLPQATGEPIDSGTDEDVGGKAKHDPTDPEADSPATPPETTS